MVPAKKSSYGSPPGPGVEDFETPVVFFLVSKIPKNWRRQYLSHRACINDVYYGTTRTLNDDLPPRVVKFACWLCLKTVSKLTSNVETSIRDECFETSASRRVLRDECFDA